MASVIKDSTTTSRVGRTAQAAAAVPAVSAAQIGQQDIVVLAALRLPDNSDRVATVLAEFVESCDRAFRATRARISSEIIEKGHSRIASFRRTKTARASALNAAVRLQMDLESQNVPYATAIGRGVDATMELIETASDGQIVVDPNLYPGLSVHSPVTAFELRAEIQKMSGLIPWFDLSDEECVLCADDPFDEER